MKESLVINPQIMFYTAKRVGHLVHCGRVKSAHWLSKLVPSLHLHWSKTDVLQTRLRLLQHGFHQIATRILRRKTSNLRIKQNQVLINGPLKSRYGYRDNSTSPCISEGRWSTSKLGIWSFLLVHHCKCSYYIFWYITSFRFIYFLENITLSFLVLVSSHLPSVLLLFLNIFSVNFHESTAP